MNEKLKELCEANDVSLFGQCVIDEHGYGVRWMARQSVVNEADLRLSRWGQGPEPELAIAACKNAHWEVASV